MLELTRLAASHALSLRRLIGAAETPQIAPNGSKAMMLAALHAAEIDILTTFVHILVDERESRPVCSIWTLHDLVGHLADWDRYFANWLIALRGETPRGLYWDGDGDTFNQQLWQCRRGEPWATTWCDFRTQRGALLDTLSQVSNDDFMRQHPADADMPFPSIYHCAWSALEHYLDHAAGVRRRLSLALSEAVLHFHGPYTE